MPSLPPDVAFQRAANIAAAIVAQAPPFVRYRVSTTLAAPSIGEHRSLEREVLERTKDDAALVTDLPDGRTQLFHGFPVPPTFDALSYFTLSWRVDAHQNLTAYVHDVTPLTYSDVDAKQYDVVVFRLRAYKTEYAPDSSDAPDGETHLLLTPYDFIKNQTAKPDSTFYLHSVKIENASGLPAQVTYAGDNLGFTVDYGKVDGQWVVQHVHYEETLRGPLGLGRLHVIADARYDDYSFPRESPDPRLPALPPSPASPAPAPSPAPSGTP